MLSSGMQQTDNHYGPATGLHAELLVAAGFAHVGAIPCVPLRPCRFDLIVELRKQVFRVQVKRGQWEEARRNRRGYHDRAHWYTPLASGTLRAGNLRGYTTADFDFLALVCAPDRVYVIPVELLRSPQSPDRLVRILHVKPLEGAERRLDAWRGAARWEPYRNRFDVLGPVPEVPPFEKPTTPQRRLTAPPADA